MLQQLNPQLNMSFKNKKDVLNEFESKNKELRAHLTEQLRLMETRMEWENLLLLELNEFYRRRAEIEEQYSKDLKKLFNARVDKLHLLERNRSVTGASSYSLFKFYKTVLGIAHSQSVNHGVVGKVFSAKMAPRFTDIRENSGKLYQRCREMCTIGQDNMMDSVRQVGQTLKNYHLAHGQAMQAEAKLLTAKDERRKLEEASQTGSAVERRLKQVDKTMEKRREKYEFSKLKSLRERNEYLLQLESANSCMRRFFSDDMPDILDCMSCGFHNSLARAAMMHLNTEDTLKQRQESFVRLFMDTMSQLDAKQDKLHFLQSSKTAFTEPKPFHFESHKGDPVSQVCANQPDVLKDLEDRYSNLQQCIKDTGLESDELWKTLEAAEQSWLTEINVSDYYVGGMFNRAAKESRSEASDEFGPDSEQQQQTQEQKNSDTDKKRAWENGDFYLGKFAEYMVKNCHLTRLRARAAAISRAVGRESGMAPPPLPTKPRKKSIIKVNAQLIGGGRPRLFGGSVDDLDEFPVVVLSCIRLINRHGLYHQGVFRIPGSLSDVNRLKEAFERGEDPFAAATDGRDVNAAAGVLKSYLRHLEDPILPARLFDDMLDCIKRDTVAETVAQLREIFQQLSANVYRIVRFIFAFLNHLSTFSDENLMDSYNLSICLAPSFIPVPQGRDPVVFQSSVSHLMKLIIEHEAEIFTRKDVSGPVYRKLMDDEFDNFEDEEEQHSVTSDLDPDASYAVTAKYSFEARTSRELSFARGDILTVVSRLTPDWLRVLNSTGQEGFAPDAYVVRVATEVGAAAAGDVDSDTTPPPPTLAAGASATPTPDETDQPPEPAETAAAAAAPTASAAPATDASMESIDQALQEVIAGLESLTYDTESPYANPQELLNSKMHLPASKRAPDLVSDLPEAAAALAAATTGADQFALEGHADTLLVRPRLAVGQKSPAQAPQPVVKPAPRVGPKPKGK